MGTDSEKPTLDGRQVREAENVPFCPSQEIPNTVVLQGVRNISDALENRPMKFLL